MNVLIIGPIGGGGGISAVIHAITESKTWRDDRIICLETAAYKDKKKIKKIATFIGALIKFVVLTITQKIDVIHIHSSFKYSFLRKSIFALIGNLFKKNVIFHIHASDFYSFYIDQKNYLLRKFINFILRKNSTNIVLCHDWKKKLKMSYGIDNVTVIRNPNPNKILHRKTLRSHEKVIFLFMGLYIPSKGIIDLIQATALIKREGLDTFCMTLCGKGEMEREIDSKIEEYNLNGNIINKGWVSGEVKENCFKEADVLVLPSYKEGMPMVILEAFSYGLPVIATNISGIPELITHGENGFLFRPGDIESLAIYMKTMMSDAALRKRMGAKSIQYAARFDRDVIAQEWKNIYQKSIDRPKNFSRSRG